MRNSMNNEEHVVMKNTWRFYGAYDSRFQTCNIYDNIRRKRMEEIQKENE